MAKGFADINGAKLYYEVEGQGEPLVMIHAGVADHRQWNNEFAYFAKRYRAIRYDWRGQGASEPVAGDFSYLKDLIALLDFLNVREPAIVLGCSMGGGMAINLALAQPSRVKALILVGSGPNGLELDVPEEPRFADVEAAFEAGDLDRVCELETQIWFDGVGRTAEQVDQAARQLLWDMNRLAVGHAAKNLGDEQPDLEPPATGRLGEIQVPVLVVVGLNDTVYIRAAADYMVDHIANARKVMMENAAHLPNMEKPEEFRRIVEAFLQEIE